MARGSMTYPVESCLRMPLRWLTLTPAHIIINVYNYLKILNFNIIILIYLCNNLQIFLNSSYVKNFKIIVVPHRPLGRVGIN